jgi:hypothetical protein
VWCGAVFCGGVLCPPFAVRTVLCCLIVLCVVCSVALFLTVQYKVLRGAVVRCIVV